MTPGSPSGRRGARRDRGGNGTIIGMRAMFGELLERSEQYVRGHFAGDEQERMLLDIEVFRVRVLCVVCCVPDRE